MQATGVSGAIAIAAGNDMTLALRSNGQVLSCRSGIKGELANNASGRESTFVAALMPVG